MGAVAEGSSEVLHKAVDSPYVAHSTTPLFYKLYEDTPSSIVKVPYHYVF